MRQLRWRMRPIGNTKSNKKARLRGLFYVLQHTFSHSKKHPALNPTQYFFSAKAPTPRRAFFFHLQSQREHLGMQSIPTADLLPDTVRDMNNPSSKKIPDATRLSRVGQMCIFSGQINCSRSLATARIDLRPKNVQMRRYRKPPPTPIKNQRGSARLAPPHSIRTATRLKAGLIESPFIDEPGRVFRECPGHAGLDDWF